jgi:hypothetical protein
VGGEGTELIEDRKVKLFHFPQTINMALTELEKNAFSYAFEQCLIFCFLLPGYKRLLSLKAKICHPLSPPSQFLGLKA